MNETQRAQYLAISRMLNAGISVEVPTESYLRTALLALKPLGPGLTDEHFDLLFDEIARVISISVNTGVIIEAPDHKPWLAGRRANIDWRLWTAFSTWQINGGRSPLVIDNLDQSLDLILDHMGNPAEEGSWSRRGLVIGDVQSGKTGTYLGLIDKAADAGYRVFILLTGNTESLRQQTQSRVDQGVIGRDSMSTSRSTIEQSNKPKAVGIGKLLESTSSAMNMTTMTTDFRKNSTQAVDISPGPDNLVFFVTKKNKTVLDRIAEWLEKQDNTQGRLQVPLLLIDDESDYASINTKNPDESPTAINAGIRRLLSLFSRSSYVGFTATPFANIFIDDEKPEDLFPKDFIFGLEAPSNYIGPNVLFGADRQENEDDAWIVIEDAEELLPVKHKSPLKVAELPDSLREAIRVFLLSNAIRDLRGHQLEPRSMLINVSRYNLVQAQVHELVAIELAAYRNAIQLHAKAYAQGARNATLDEIAHTFRERYPDSGENWDAVLDALPAAVSEIQCLLVNSKADKKLEQDELSAAAPPRLIAVGGDLLSRGLTLEGLTISYFYRRTAAADTLMQMGRWFGYREGYADLCRLWIDAEMVAAYAHAADALDELRLELRRMRNQKLTPEEYGLAVANHPGSLLITARNKMRAAKVGQKQISLRGRTIESYKLSTRPDVIEANYEAAQALIETLSEDGSAETTRKNRLIWRDVPKSTVGDFLAAFKAHESFDLFQENALARFVRNASADDLQTWDVVLMEGAGDKRVVGGLSVNLTTRAFDKNGSNDAWLVSGRRQRLAGPGDISATLPEETVRRIRGEYAANPLNAGKASVPDAEFVYALARPVLLVYLVDAIQDAKRVSATPFAGVVLALPGARDEKGSRREADEVTYILNKPAQRLWFPELMDVTQEDDDDV